VDVSRFGLAYVSDIVRLYDEVLDRDLHVLDLTTDFGIPVVAAISRQRGRPTEDITVGFSAHLDAGTAVVRALVGANQYLPALSKTKPDGSTRYRMADPETIAWWRTATYANQPYLVPNAAAAVKTAGDYPGLAGQDLLDDVRFCLDAARRLGLEVLVVDQTRPDIGMPVVKVIVPGLRHFWPRFAPGRLYDVPVALGWRDRPLDESQLNPIACFV